MQSTAADLVDGARAGDRGAIARLISLVESGGPDADDAVARLFPHTGNAYTIGVTGAPGAGKSTLTDRLVTHVRCAGDDVGVLAIDPSSPFTGGAILGDRVRMQDHATDDGVFIRSMATRGHLGGLALATPQAIRVLDAAGKPWVIVETVGVGQVEVEVASATDTVVVVVNPGWGDGVQAAKAGLLEIADVLVINKADRPGREETERDLAQMLELAGHREWQPPIVATVATEDQGIEELWSVITSHREFLGTDGRLDDRRARRVGDEIRSIVGARLSQRAGELCAGEEFSAAVKRVIERATDPYAAADSILRPPGRS